MSNTKTKEKTYRLRKIMSQWHVLIYADGEIVGDNPFSDFDKAQRFADGLDIRDGDRG